MGTMGKLTQNGVHLEDHEYKTIKFFLERGYDIELIPPSQIRGVHTADFTMNGFAWEMKSPIADGKYTIKNIVQNASHQSNNIVIDLRRCKLNEEKAIREIRRHFELSKRIRRIIVIRKGEEMIDISK